MAGEWYVVFSKYWSGWLVFRPVPDDGWNNGYGSLRLVANPKKPRVFKTEAGALQAAKKRTTSKITVEKEPTI